MKKAELVAELATKVISVGPPREAGRTGVVVVYDYPVLVRQSNGTVNQVIQPVYVTNEGTDLEVAEYGRDFRANHVSDVMINALNTFIASQEQNGVGIRKIVVNEMNVEKKFATVTVLTQDAQGQITKSGGIIMRGATPALQLFPLI